MAAFVTARVDDQHVFGIRCPFEGCTIEIFEQDVEKLVQCGALTPAVQKRLAELRKQDYTGRLTELTDETQPRTKEDFQLMRQLWATTRRCPRCNVILQKSEGCNSFGCICGHRFDFSKAPRGCGEDVSDFDALTQLAIDFDMPMTEAKELLRQAAAKGIVKYKCVTRVATQKQIPLSLAEVHVQAMLGQGAAIAQLKDARLKRRHGKKAEVLASKLGMSFGQAEQLLEQAAAGDAAAWKMIQEARRLPQSSTCIEASLRSDSSMEPKASSADGELAMIQVSFGARQNSPPGANTEPTRRDAEAGA